MVSGSFFRENVFIHSERCYTMSHRGSTTSLLRFAFLRERVRYSLELTVSQVDLEPTVIDEIRTGTYRTGRGVQKDCFGRVKVT